MEPVSCVNCCHNPLQLGPVGTSFGYCTRHRLVLPRPQLTTCGLLLRKDLLAESASREQRLHARSYPTSRVSLVSDPRADAARRSLAEKPNGNLPRDVVLEEVADYGSLDSKIATMAALHQVPGCRAEVAMLSLSRGYFKNCLEHRGVWTAGVHLAYWTLERLDAEPQPAATDLRGPLGFSVAQATALAQWAILAFRLAFLADVGTRAGSDPIGVLSRLAADAAAAAPPTDPGRLLKWLGRKRSVWRAALTPSRYARLKESLHRDGGCS